MCCNEILGCFHGGWGEENLLTVVVVEEKWSIPLTNINQIGSNLQDIVVVS